MKELKDKKINVRNLQEKIIYTILNQSIVVKKILENR